ncbi:putative metallopeptidase, partial [Acinetobacter baumannii]
PKHYLAGHDVEEFIGVVKRWGPSKNIIKIYFVIEITNFLIIISVLYLPFKFIQLGCRLFFWGQKF